MSIDADFYVSRTGKDSWSGTISSANGADGPFATLERARDAVRKLKNELSQRGEKRPITVGVAEGTYQLSKPFTIGPEDSGSIHTPITYRAMPDKQPVLSGGREISEWAVQDDGVWSATLPAVADGSWYFRSLWVDNVRRPRACLPKKGYYTVAGQVENRHQGFRFNPGEITDTWHNIDDVEIVVVQFWTEARLRIQSVDTAASTVTFTGASWRPLDWSKAWFVENVREGLNRPGEWYLDRSNGVISYIPMPGEQPDNVTVIAPINETLVEIAGTKEKPVEWVTVEGFRMHHTFWQMPYPHGISIPQAEIPRKEGVVFAGNLAYGENLPQVNVDVPSTVFCSWIHNCSITNNEIAHTGGWAIELFDGCRNNRIDRNHIFDIGAGAVRIGDPACPKDDDLETSDTKITNNVIHDGSQVYLGPAAIWVGQSSRNIVSHNEIYNSFEWGISVGWSWNYWPPARHRDNIVEYNHVHHLGESHTGCHGAIYFLGVSPGTVCRNNLINHISGGCGIILDNACFGIVIERNITYHTGAAGLCFNYNDSGNIVQNNIFALSKAHTYERFGDPPATGGEKVDQTGILYRNIFYWSEGSFMRRDSWPNFDTLMDYNLYWDTREKEIRFAGLDFRGWQSQGLDKNSLIADPLFSDPDSGDFTLDPKSPAYLLGLSPIDLSKVGPRRAGPGSGGDSLF